MNYPDSIARLLSLVDHERSAPTLPRQKRIYDLRNVKRLLGRIGNPHRRPGIVHVAGTKGKGSTAAMIEAILRAAGYSTGFYSSPHLHSFCERIRLDGESVSPSTFAELTASVWPQHVANADDPEAGPATLFEFMTAMAFHCFAENQTDFSVIEVGLGGRLDATNVVTPAVSVITPVSLDHTAILGDTIGEIAADKAGIIKPGVPVVVAPQFPEAMAAIQSAATAQSAPLVDVAKSVAWRVDGTSLDGQDLNIQTPRDTYQFGLPLLGDFQGTNAAVALTVAENLIGAGHEIHRDAVIAGLSTVQWPARLEVLSRNPIVVADGAHNDHSVATVLATLKHSIPHQKLTVVAGFSRDKRVSAMVEFLAQRARRVIATRSRHPRSMRPSEIVDEFCAHGFNSERIVACNNVSEAINAAWVDAESGELILVTGSLFVAAEAREAILGISPETYPDLLPPDLR
ncbi:MAG: bifunctional folylpolyglutamate synthase/dihydrofolate synthase [Chloroflexi bacterium]|nr:bifunctional folylpolyglutamate synthase/dihydrofolate synthase [Chloroflexota bacterium]